VYVDINRERNEKPGVTPGNVFNAMQVYLGSTYINDFNYLGRTYEVIVQADGRFRRDVDDIGRLRTRNERGEMVPVGSVARLSEVTAPYRVPHYNLYPGRRGHGQPGTLA
jgi:multidrug efflux pump subunit AcrB